MCGAFLLETGRLTGKGIVTDRKGLMDMIRLERFERKDIPLLLGWMDSERLLHQWGGTGFRYPLDEKQLEEYVKSTMKDDADTLAYRAVMEKTGKTVGHISLSRINRRHRTGRVSHVLVGDPEVRGQGIGEQMMRELLKIAFQDLQLHRVSLGVFDFNQPAIALYEKIGFTKEGLLRDTLLVQGAYWSIWEMSMLEDEWRQEGRSAIKSDKGVTGS